jgi:hypothetical protein
VRNEHNSSRSQHTVIVTTGWARLRCEELRKAGQSSGGLVDVRAEVTPALEKKLNGLGATIVSTSREYHSIVAWVPLLALERIAADRTVTAIGMAPRAQTAR